MRFQLACASLLASAAAFAPSPLSGARVRARTTARRAAADGRGLSAPSVFDPPSPHAAQGYKVATAAAANSVPYVLEGEEEAAPPAPPQQFANQAASSGGKPLGSAGGVSLGASLLPAVGAGIAISAGGYFGRKKWAARKVTLLEDYAEYMVAYDSNYDEMAKIHSRYGRKLLPKGLMFEGYVRELITRKPVAPQLVRSLAYTVSLFGMSDAKAAAALCEMCSDKKMYKQPALRAKILFAADRVFTAEKANAALQPLRELASSSYRSKETGAEILKVSQRAMAERAYRDQALDELGSLSAAELAEAGLPDGWDLLGLAEADAQAIVDEVRAEGGSKRDYTKYYEEPSDEEIEADKDFKADALAAKLLAKSLEDWDEDDEDGGAMKKEPAAATGGVYECGECGYTLFVAKGRDFKFYGDDFKCPECGTGKDGFSDRSAGGGDDDEGGGGGEDGDEE